MGSDSEKECCDAMKHRIIPKLMQTEKNDHVGEKKQSVFKRKTMKKTKRTNQMERKKQVKNVLTESAILMFHLWTSGFNALTGKC